MANENLGDRWRYIAFKIEGGAKVARNDFLGAMIAASRSTPLANSFRITVFEGISAYSRSRTCSKMMR
jgi:hypothetical protein